ncbi:MAG: hypothetical protein QOF96_4084 [Actinomycetota bacterium]|jgi:hypothetical protein|nr:hypothetical protein [Actinomycetota bacterium]
MKDTLTGVLRQCATVLLEDQDSIAADDVVECAYRRHPGVMAMETERLVRNAAVRIVKEIMRELSSDEEEGDNQPFPGLGLPTAIAVPAGDDYRYVRSDKATLDQLEAGEIIRVHNVASAVAALDRYRSSVTRLRPFFNADHQTVNDAYGAWRESQGGAA